MLKELFVNILNNLLKIESLSALVLTITALIMYQQVKETRKSIKFLEYQIKPMAYPFLTRKEKKTCLYVKSDWKFKILFNFEVMNSNNEVIQKFRDQPLNIYPIIQGSMQYPNAFRDLDNYLEKFPEITKIKIKYKISPANVPLQEYTDYPTEEWQLKNNNWVGPDGIEASVIEKLIKL